MRLSIQSEQRLTAAVLGVPSWFTHDGCSGPTPVREFTTGPCAAHDWAYYVGSTAAWAELRRREADRDFRARIKHNARAYSEHSQWRYWWKSALGEVYYWGVVKLGKRAWQIRTREEIAVLRAKRPGAESIARKEGRHVESGEMPQ